MENLTDREKAAVIMHVYTGESNRQILFSIADEKNRITKITSSSYKTIASNWFKSHKIQTAIKYYQDQKQNQDNETIKKYLLENQTEETEPQKKVEPINPTEDVNFLDPESFLAFANQKANEITDEKERRAYLEMIAKLMNYKDKEEGETEVLRAYLPLQCYSCELKKRCERCEFANCQSK